jgi:hypothetical protein
VPTGATFASAGTNWSGIAASSTYLWRVRKAKASSPVGFGKSNSNEFGLVAPRKGQYSLTVTGTNWTTTRAIGIYYQDQDGNHRLKFNVVGSISVGVTSFTGTISGVTFKNISGFTQAISACLGESGVAARVTLESYVNPNASTFVVATSSGNMTLVRISGDVELDSKPTWA